MMSSTESMETCSAESVGGGVTADLSQFLTRSELNKIIMNYLVTEGYQDACEVFHQESGIQPHVPLESLDQRVKVRDKIFNGQILEAISLVDSLYPGLLADHQPLFFQLQKQHLIELIRDKKVIEALEFAQTHLAEEGVRNKEVLAELEEVMALLAFIDPLNSPFAELLLESQRHKLASQVNELILASENQSTSVQLTSIYKLLLWTQQELDQKKVLYDRMIDISNGAVESSSSQ